jgi:hypothetical protein
MNARNPWTLLFNAWLLILLPVGLFFGIAHVVFDPSNFLDHSFARIPTAIAFIIGIIGGWFYGTRTVLGFMNRGFRPIPLVGLMLALPTVLAGAIYAHAWIVFGFIPWI